MQFSSDFIRRLEYLSLIAKRYYRERRVGFQQSLAKGTSIDFKDYRPYTPGDDFRSVDWNIYSRFDELFTKLFEHEQEIPIYVLIDTSESMLEGSPEKARFALEIAATIAYIALSNQDRAALLSFSDDVEVLTRPLRGRGYIHHVLEVLERLEPTGTTDLRASLSSFVRRSLSRGIVVVISDFLSPSGVVDALREVLAYRYELIVVQLAAQEDRTVSFDGQVELEDTELGEVHPVLVTRDVQKRYAEIFGEFCDEIESVCRKAGMVYVFSGCDESLEDIIMTLLRKGGLVGK